MPVAPLASAPVVDGRIAAAEYALPAITIATASGDVRVRLGVHGDFLYVGATLPDSTFYWGDDLVISIDPDGSGGDSPDINDRQWYVRRILDSSVVTTVREKTGGWSSAGDAATMLGQLRDGIDWKVASTSDESGWMVELRISRAALPSPGIAVRTYNDRPHGWWSWPLPPTGTAPARVERVPRLWIPLQLGAGVCAAGPDADALLAEVRGWVARQPVDSAFGAKPLRSDDIVLESGESICRTLAEAYAKLPGEVFTPESVNVVKAGAGYYVMFDPNVMAGNARSVMIFDSSYVLRGSRPMTVR